MKRERCVVVPYTTSLIQSLGIVVFVGILGASVVYSACFFGQKVDQSSMQMAGDGSNLNSLTSSSDFEILEDQEAMDKSMARHISK